ncbi:MAG: hypothetical protein V7719_09100 [Psychroserpens sp.]|uniref:hypothetical protein n=1 Tax=Psychroserpens sp. TaxID=2020870 RepID=UPI0030011C2C
MKTIKTILLAACALLMLPFTTLAQEDESFLLNTTAFTIKFGHGENFTDGVKKWNKCYKDNNGTATWRVWHRLQGKGNVYILASNMQNWAEMDESDPAGKACRSTALTFITPHIESRETNIARSMPKVSRKESIEGMSIVWVTSFTVNDGTVFNEILGDVNSTISSKEGFKRGYWYRVLGGEGANYFVSTPYKDFADLDKDTAGVWEVYESVHGKSKTKDVREKFRATWDKIWSYTYTLDKDLTMN